MYNNNIDKKWQKVWNENKSFKAIDNSDKEKFYSLVEFPYPSGVGLHVGHVRAYMGMEVLSRMKRLQGYNVLFPIGFDAFGLPTENYAMKTGIHPRKVTDDNIATFLNQLKSIGFSFDFDRQIDTTSNEYLKWTQWIFLKLFEKGLAYKDKTLVNYCPNCRVILANEESQGNVCDRCDSPIVQKEKEVWMLKITDYADKLLDELENIDFPERVKAEQINWIGRSYGAEVDFKIKDIDDKLKVYTTRPDTIFGVTFMAIAPEHDILDKLKDKITNYNEVLEYRKKAMSKTEFERTKLVKEKTGVILDGISCINPVTGEEIPIVVADYVMTGYGTGAIMAVPAHDTRDYEFAKKFGFDIKTVIAMDYTDTSNPPLEGKEYKNREGVLVVVKHWEEEKYILLDWKEHNWKDLITGGIEDDETPTEAAIRELKEETGYTDVKDTRVIEFEHFDNFYAAHKGVNRRIYQRDIFIELNSGEKINVSDEEKSLFDVRWLTKDEMYETINLENHRIVFDQAVGQGKAYTGDGVLVNSEFLNGLNKDEAIVKMVDFLEENKLGNKKTNYHMKDWAFARQRYWGEPIPIVKCENCGLVPLEEKDLPLVLPKVKNFIPGEDGESPLAKIDEFINCKCPKCNGNAKRETDTMPQWAGSSWYFLRYTDPTNSEVFADKKLLDYWLPVDQYNGGMEHVTRHLIYSRFWHRFLYDIGEVPTKEPYAKRSTQGLILGSDGNKMSKSKGNVVDPKDIIDKYGADTLRTYILFIGDYGLNAPWNDDAVKGVKKFLDRVVKLVDLVEDNVNNKDLEIEKNIMIKKVSEDIVNMKYNTAIACMMSYVNLLYKKSKLSIEDIKDLLVVLNPIAPHVTEEVWEKLGLEGYVFNSNWPKYDENKLTYNDIEMAVLVKSKVKFKITVDKDLDTKSIEEIIKKDERLNEYDIKKIIVVKGRVINIVV